MNELTKKDEKSLLPVEFNEFNEEEINGGIERQQKGYLQSYNYQINVNGNSFEVYQTNLSERKLVTTLNTINKVILFYYHGVISLNKKDLMQTDDDELLAITYGNPWKGDYFSRGSFDSNGYGKYLDDKTYRKDTRKRLYMFMALPGILPNGQIAAATFGTTTYKSLNEITRFLDQQRIPLPLVFLNMTLVPDSNEGGQKYNRVNFDLIKNESGLMTTVKNNSLYKEYIYPVQSKICETHKAVIKSYENQVEKTIEREPIEQEQQVSNDITDDDIPF